MTYENFALTITLKTPVIMNHPKTLDGIVGGMLHQIGVPGDEAAKCKLIEHASIEGCDGIPLATYFFIDADETLDIRTQVISKVPTRNHAALHHVLGRCVSDLPTKPGTSKSPDYTMQTVNTRIDNRRLTFLASGDIEEIGVLLDKCGAIGSKHSSGYGEIDHYDFEKVDFESPLDIIRINGKPTRPLPAGLSHLFGHGTYFRDRGRWKSPYSPHLAKNYGHEIQDYIRPRTFSLGGK